MRNIFHSLRYTLLALSLTISMVGIPVPVSAQIGNLQVIPKAWTSAPCNIKTGQLAAQCVPMLIASLISLVFSVISAFFLLNVIFAGYQIALGSWTGEKSQGKDRLVWSIIGLVVCVCAFLILDLVVSVILP